MIGNVFELTRGAAGRAAIRGGGWYYFGFSGQIANRTDLEPVVRNPHTGFRVCASW